MQLNRGEVLAWISRIQDAVREVRNEMDRLLVYKIGTIDDLEKAVKQLEDIVGEE